MSLTAVPELRRGQTGIPPVHVLLGKAENAVKGKVIKGARRKPRKLTDLKVQNRSLQ